MGQKRKVYSKEFKEQAVLLSETSGKSVIEIAHDLGISEDMLWRWKRERRESGDRSFIMPPIVKTRKNSSKLSSFSCLYVQATL